MGHFILYTQIAKSATDSNQNMLFGKSSNDVHLTLQIVTVVCHCSLTSLERYPIGTPLNDELHLLSASCICCST